MFSSVCWSDEVILKNGDRMTGEVVRIESGKLTFKTTYAGEIQIEQEAISRLMSDQRMLLLMKDEQKQRAEQLKFSGDNVQIVNGAEVDTVPESAIVMVNPEPWRTGDGYQITGAINAAMEIQSGNTESDEIDLDGNVQIRRQHDRLKFAGELEYDRSQDITTKEKAWFKASYDRFPKRDKRFGLNAKSWYYGANAFLEKDEFADLRLRAGLGPHVGYQFYESKPMNLSFENGVLWVSEDFTDDSEDQDFFSYGWTLNFDRFLIEDVVQVYHNQNGILELGGDNKLVHKSWTGLRFPLVSGLVASAEIKLEYDSEPASDKDELDTTYKFKLGYHW
ncbi:MAG: DUF481 domain-containing protein [bacterium]